MNSPALTKEFLKSVKEFKSLHLCYTWIYQKSYYSKTYSGFIEDILKKIVTF